MSKKTVFQLKRLHRLIRMRHTVMVMSGPESQVRHFSLPGAALVVVAIVCTLGILGGGASLVGWTGSQFGEAQVSALRSENERLYSQIREIRDNMEFLEATVEETSLMEQEFRSLANLNEISSDVRRLGVGGPAPLSELDDRRSPSYLVREARETLDRIDELSRKARFQNDQFQLMVTSLQANQEKLNHTPSVSPVRHARISSGYGTRDDPFTGRPTMHRGVDFSAAIGTPVYATADGRVKKAGRAGTLGYMVEIDHGNGFVTRYGHNSKLLVKAGQRVKRGDLIAEVGSTGRSTSPHCHYEVLIDGRHANPYKYLLDRGKKRGRRG